jgi:pyruvate kinase
MPESLDVLITRLDEIEADLQAEVLAHRGEIAAVSPEHRTGATNLVRYTSQKDLRDLQNDLLDLGATSRATAEANVQAKGSGGTERPGGTPRGSRPVGPRRSQPGARRRRRDSRRPRASAVRGTQRPGRPTRIMVTMPTEAADDPELLATFVAAGMDIARINFAHDGPAAWERMIGHIRAVADAAGRTVLVSMDLAGPKLRTGPTADGPAVGRARVSRDDTGRLIASAKLRLVSSDRPEEEIAAWHSGVPAPESDDQRPAQPTLDASFLQLEDAT